MSNYTWRELLKQNIVNVFSKIELKRKEKKKYRKDWWEGKLPVKNTEYMDLAPKSDIKNGEEYINMLH